MIFKLDLDINLANKYVGQDSYSKMNQVKSVDSL